MNKTKKYKNKVTYSQYLELMKALDIQEEEIRSINYRNSKLQLQRTKNTRAIITILFYTGIRISDMLKITVIDIERAIFTQFCFDVDIGVEGVNTFSNIFSLYLNEESTNYILRKYKKPKSNISIHHAGRIVNLLLKKVLGDEYVVKSFRKKFITIEEYKRTLMRTL